MQTENIAADDLNVGALLTIPQDRDWSEGYGETWDYIAAPCCPQCGNYARWSDVPDLIESVGLDAETDAEKVDALPSENWECWRCADPECERFACEVEREGDDGPMMNYAYPLPDGRDYDESDAEKIAHLPLCIVRYDDGSNRYELALSGGGMDLSWEICEAFMVLGYLPPVHFADLPAMAGRGPIVKVPEGASNPDAYRKAEERRARRDAAIIAACRRSAAEYAERAKWKARNIARAMDLIEGKASEPDLMTAERFLCALFAAIKDDTEPFIDVARRAGLMTDSGEYVSYKS